MRRQLTAPRRPVNTSLKQGARPRSRATTTTSFFVANNPGIRSCNEASCRTQRLDATIADIAVATNCGQIKTGSLSRSEGGD